MPSDAARLSGPQFDRIAATLAALVVVGLAVFLLVRNQPIADPKLFFVLRVVLSFSAATLGATIPGFLDIRWSGSGLAIRAGGALALFVLTFVYTPDVLTEQGGKPQTTIIAPNSQVTINNGTDSAAVLAAISDLKQQLTARSAVPAVPGAEQRVGEAIRNLARGAANGDDRLQKALELLRANKVNEAAQLLQAVAEEKTARIQVDSKDAATAYRNLGAIAGLGNPQQALAAYLKAIELDPNDSESLLWAGWFEADRGQLDEAERDFRRILELTEGNEQAGTRVGATLGYGDIRKQRGDLPGALKSYRDALAIAERLAKAEPGNANWQRDLSVSYNRIGDVQQAQGDLATALSSYQAALAIMERLTEADPGNALWQRDLSVSHSKIGDVQQAQGDLAAALSSYQASLAIAERLAKADPGNAGWQRDLAVSYEKVGDVRQAQGDLGTALASYQASHDIFDRLAKADPGNAGWQRSLSVSHMKIGDVQQAQGDLAAALSSYQASFAIAERLTKADPGNAGWQRDLAMSYGRIASIEIQQGDRDDALKAFRQGRDIIAQLMKKSPDNATLHKDLASFDSQIGTYDK